MDTETNLRKENQPQKAHAEDEIDLRELFRIFVKRKWWFVGAVIATILIGVLYIFVRPSSYMVTYQIKLNEEYKNDTLSEFYPSYAARLNFPKLSEVPTILNSEVVFESINSISGKIDPDRLRSSEAVKIVLNKDTSIFNISVANLDYDLANKINKTLISSFKDYVRNRQTAAFDELLSKLKTDVRGLKHDSIGLQKEIANLEEQIDDLYAKLNEYIIDYNVSLFNELEKNKKGESNWSFYNVVIPPNKISYEISVIQKEIDVYRDYIIKSEQKILILNDLYEKLLRDKDIIFNRVEMISESPMCEIQGYEDRSRNIAIILILSIVIGAIVTFVANIFLNLRHGRG